MTDMSNRWTMTLRLYRLPSTLNDEGKDEPEDNDTVSLQNTIYSANWQVKPNLMDYDNKTLQTTLYSKR